MTKLYTSKNSLLIGLALFLGGCGTIDKGPLASCGELNWYELGRADGVRGEPSLSWQKRVASCSDFGDTEHRRYTNGWYAGVDRFCSAEHGYVFGKTGQTYYDVCPQGKESEFLKTYQDGLKAFLFERSMDRTKAILREQKQRLAKAETPSEKAQVLQNINRLERQQVQDQEGLTELESKRNSLEL